MTEQAVPAPLDAGLALLLRRAEHALAARLQPLITEHGLLPEHWQVMSVLLLRPGIGMSELAHGAVVSPASLTRHIDRLVSQALVVRRVDPDDKRRVVVALSPRGVDVARAVRAAEEAVEQMLADELGARRWQSLAGDLRVLPPLVG